MIFLSLRTLRLSSEKEFASRRGAEFAEKFLTAEFDSLRKRLKQILFISVISGFFRQTPLNIAFPFPSDVFIG